MATRRSSLGCSNVLVIEDFIDWRNKARALLQADVHPEEVRMGDRHGSQDLFTASVNSAAPMTTVNAKQRAIFVPRAFIQHAHWVAHHSSPDRWQLMYSLAWRQVHENKHLMANPIDDQVAKFNRLMKAVSRDHHKMKAFVRFQSIADFTGDATHYSMPEVIEPEQMHARKRNKQTRGNVESKPINTNALQKTDPAVTSEAEHFIAWFEPEHFIVPLAAPFFVKRFNSMSWSILTPYECAHWHQGKLVFTGGAARPPMPEDQTEHLWLQYYAGIFNPARVKVNAMQAEMPKKYWKNLPEAQLIKDLLRNATRRVDAMINEC